jgi:hypothetical protein
LLCCPACNGLQSLSAPCPQCQSDAADYGRSIDYLGPYSPYRYVDDISMTNGNPDNCIHVLSCKNCNYTFTKEVAKWFGSTHINGM